MTTPEFYDEHRWVQYKNKTWHPIGSTHTHPGHFVAWNPATNEFRTLTRPELTDESEAARHWLDGYLAANGKTPPIDADPATEQAWREAYDTFRRTGAWPRQFGLYPPQNRVDAAAALTPASLVELAIAEFGDIGPAPAILTARITNQPISYPETAVLASWTRDQYDEAITLCIAALEHSPDRFPTFLARAIAEAGHPLPIDALHHAAYYAAVERNSWKLGDILQLLIDIDATDWSDPLERIHNNRDHIHPNALILLKQFKRPERGSSS